MDYLNTSRGITLIASVAITAGFYGQAFKIWKTKSAKDFTGLLVLALLIYELAWLNYGFAIKEWVVVVIGLLNIPAVVIVAVGFLRFGRSTNSEE